MFSDSETVPISEWKMKTMHSEDKNKHRKSLTSRFIQN